MTAPGLDRASLVPVMAFMQGLGLAIVAPFIVSFFVGGAILSRALAAAGVVSPWNPRLHWVALGVGISVAWPPARSSFQRGWSGSRRSVSSPPPRLGSAWRWRGTRRSRFARVGSSPPQRWC